jgi:hypothetical protein
LDALGGTVLGIARGTWNGYETEVFIVCGSWQKAILPLSPVPTPKDVYPGSKVLTVGACAAE